MCLTWLGLAFPAPARNRCSTNLVKPEDEQEVSPLAKGIGGICGKVQDGAGVVQRRQQQLAEAGGGVVRKQRVWAGKRFKMMLVVQDKFTLL